MIPARDLLDRLADLGATVRPAGEQLILRAGPRAIPAALVHRIMEAKADLLELLAAKSDATGATPVEQELLGRAANATHGNRIVRWLDQHPSPSQAGLCAHCGQSGCIGAVVVPFGVTSGTHAWLHAECWPAWHQARRAEALCALQASRYL
jgi:hypothetical protein